MGKYRKEPFITQRQGKRGWTFQVFIRSEIATITRSFNEKDYGTAKKAYECAIAFRNKTLVELSEETYLKPQLVTVQEVFDDYIENSPDSYSTKNKHVKLFGKHITTKDIPIQELTKADIINNLNQMTDTCTDDTIQRIFSIYRNDIVQHAIYKDYLNKDLLAGMKCPKSRVLHVKKSTETDRETILAVEKIIKNSQMNSYNKYLIVYLIEVLYYTGMRPAEAEALTRDDIKDGYIIINKQLGSSKDKMHVVTRSKTPTSDRKVPIHPELKPILEELMDYSRSHELFKKEDGRYLDSEYVGVALRNLLKDKGIKFNLYRLRHNMATSLVVNGTDAKTTMELLGHAQYSMSLGYANSSDEYKKSAIELIH